MASRKRKTSTEVCQERPPAAKKLSVKKSRYRRLDLRSAVGKCLEWAQRIENEEELLQRDEKRVHEAFQVLAQEDKGSPYCAFLRDAKLVGGCELVLLFALACGKATFRDMAGEVKWRFPLKVAETECHRSASMRDVVLEFVEEGKLDRSRQSFLEDQLAADGHSRDSSVEFLGSSTDQAVDAAPGTARAQAPAAQGPSNQAASQLVAPSASQSFDQTGSLTGDVFELTPIDVLQRVARLIAGEEKPEGPILLTEPWFSSMNPFITIPITIDDCLMYRRQREQIM